MLISDIQIKNNQFTLPDHKTNKTHATSFSEILEKKTSITMDNTNNSISDDFNFKPKFHAYMSSGEPVDFPSISFNVNECLTNSDKSLLQSVGWTENGENTLELNELAGRIAIDRVDGILKGPVTKQYLFGNCTSDSPGLLGIIQSPHDYSSNMKGLFIRLGAGMGVSAESINKTLHDYAKDLRELYPNLDILMDKI